MNDITHKFPTLRIALAQAVVKVSSRQTMDRILAKTVPKGDVFEMAKAAGMLAVKKTSDLIPDCHPIPVEAATFRFETSELEIKILLEVKTIYKTGVEVEAMHGASVAALTMYDMLKPIDKQVEIHSIKLLEKKGGKSDFPRPGNKSFRAAVVVCSDSVAAGKGTDRSGKAIVKRLEAHQVEIADYCVIPDEAEEITERAIRYCNEGIDLVIFTGGTGASARDVTPETLRPLVDREFPAIMEAARNYGQQRTPLAMLSRGIAGTRGKTLFITLPGSVRAVEESMEAIFPHVLHIFRMMEGGGHA